MKICSFLPSATEIVCALGLSDALAGITYECDYPLEVRGKTVVVGMRLAHAAAARVIDAGGNAAAPGFLNVHAHVENNIRSRSGQERLKYPVVASCSWGTSLNGLSITEVKRARVLGRYVREQGVLTLEDAVRKMTSLPAQRFGLTDRGLLRPGMWADVVVFDPETVIDRATFARPHAYSEGIHFVLVNGEVVIDRGRHTGARPGQPLFGPGTR